MDKNKNGDLDALCNRCASGNHLKALRRSARKDRHRACVAKRSQLHNRAEPEVEDDLERTCSTLSRNEEIGLPEHNERHKFISSSGKALMDAMTTPQCDQR